MNKVSVIIPCYNESLTIGKVVEILDKGRINMVELMHYHQDGHTFPMMMNGILVRSEKGDPGEKQAAAGS